MPVPSDSKGRLRKYRVPDVSEKPCLGCNGLSRITGLQGIKIPYKPLAGWLIRHPTPSPAIIGHLRACKTL
jgi:hypothetical protein